MGSDRECRVIPAGGDEDAAGRGSPEHHDGGGARAGVGDRARGSSRTKWREAMKRTASWALVFATAVSSMTALAAPPPQAPAGNAASTASDAEVPGEDVSQLPAVLVEAVR